jgi:hypothetical protein
MQLGVTQDTVRHILTAEMLAPFLPQAPRILAIGDGFGTCAGALRTTFPHATIHCADLSFALAEQRERLTRAFGETGFTFSHAQALEADGHDRQYDLAINIASMLEMDPPEVARYFGFLRGRVDLFYCCNRESKTLPDGAVSRFDHYPWSTRDEVLVDEPCPWHQWYIHPKPPWKRRYDGVHRHRLARLSAVA